MSGADIYAAFYVLVIVPAALYVLWRASLIPPTNTYDDESATDDRVADLRDEGFAGHA